MATGMRLVPGRRWRVSSHWSVGGGRESCTRRDAEVAKWERAKTMARCEAIAPSGIHDIVARVRAHAIEDVIRIAWRAQVFFSAVEASTTTCQVDAASNPKR